MTADDQVARAERALCRPLRDVLAGKLKSDQSVVAKALVRAVGHLAAKGFSGDEIAHCLRAAAAMYSNDERHAAVVSETIAEVNDRVADGAVLLPPCAATGCHFGARCADPARRIIPFARLAKALDHLAVAELDDRTDLLRALIGAAPFLDRLDQARLVAELKQHRPAGLKASDVEEAVRAAIRAQRVQDDRNAAAEADNVEELGVQEQDGVYVRVTESKHGRAVTTLSTFVHRPIRVVETEEGELVEGPVVTPDGKEYDDLVLGPEDWKSPTNYKTKINRHGRLAYLGGEQGVQSIMHLVHTTPGVPRVPGTTVLGQHLRDGKWCYVDANGCLTADGETTETFVFASPWDPPIATAILLEARPTPEQLHEMAARLFTFNAPMITTVINGWAAAALHKPRLRTLLGEGFPHLCITGPKGSAKTQTEEKILRRLFAIKKSAMSARKATDFTLLHASAGANCIPLVIEEYKPSKMPVRAVQAVESLMRDAYDGHAADRGRRNLSVRSYRQQAPIVLVGEERPTEPAILERTVLLVFSKETSRPAKKEFQELIKQPLGGLGRLVLEHGVRMTDAEWEAILSLEDAAISADLTDRVRANAVQVRAGIRLLEAVFRANKIEVDFSGFLPLVDSALMELVLDGRKEPKSVVSAIIEEWATQAGMTRRQEAQAAVARAVRDDLEGLIPVPRPRSAGFDVVYQVSWANGRPELGISIAQTYPGFKEWAKRTCYDGEVPDKDSFLSGLKQEKYYLGDRAMRHGGDVVKMHVLDLAAMRAERLEVEGFGSGTNGHSGATATITKSAPDTGAAMPGPDMNSAMTPPVDANPPLDA